MVDTIDLFNQAMEKQPVDFAATFDQLMRQKAQTKVASQRDEMAQSIYSDEDTEIDYTDDSLPDIDDDDFVGLGDDNEDFDLDLGDLDLDDNEE